MNDIRKAFRETLEQAFLPIFVKDNFDSATLIAACQKAGCRSIEYTLRRADAHSVIPTLCEDGPRVNLFVGSTLDSEAITLGMKKKYPQLMTIPELARLPICGMVSMLSWSRESLLRYGKDLLIAPLAQTVGEALRMMDAGATFIKLMGTNLDLVKSCRASATFDFCPIFVTGGMTLTRIPLAFDAGACLVGAGFDLILKGEPDDVSVDRAAERLHDYLDVAQKARAKAYPALADLTALSDEAFFDALPFYHRF